MIRALIWTSLFAVGASLSASTAFAQSQLDAAEQTKTSKLNQQQRFEKLSRYLDAINDQNKLMGSVSLRKSGQVIYQYSFGYRDIENKLKANEHTKYQIGSITKTYTSVLIMQLVEQGKLQLDQSIVKYFPGIPNSKKITIEHLLSHQSGIYNFTDDPTYPSYMTQTISKPELVSKISAFESLFEPGSEQKYSNSNFVLLGFIVEELTGLSFQEALKQNITKPLKLADTYFGDGIVSAENEALSYQYKGKWKKATETDMSVPAAAGAIAASANDVTLFFHALFNGKLLKPDTLKLMLKPKGLGFGLGYMPFYEHTAYGHGGRIDGFVSSAGYFSDSELSIALLANGVNGNVNDVMIALLSAYYDKPFNIPVAVKKEPVGKLNLEDYIGIYASKHVPLKIKVFVENAQLMAQATGQGAFPLTATAKHEFSFDRAGIVIMFNPESKTLVLNQGGAAIPFELENN